MQYRMYFFVPYNISDIQKGIQAGHAAIQYVVEYGHSDEFRNFFVNDKTWIILNGGTTRFSRYDDEENGELNKILLDLESNGIECSYFCEPDLNSALTAICFIADERVWDTENYPDYDSDIPEKSWVIRTGATSAIQVEPLELFEQWKSFVGGEKNVFLRELIKDKRLA